MSRDITIELKDINQRFQEKDLFKESINFTITQDKAILLYGGSGSGKTSLFNILVGLQKPSSGELFWDKQKITKLQVANKIRVSYMSVVFSNFSFINELSIKENILLGATLSNIENIEEKLQDLAATVLNFQDEDPNIDLSELLKKSSVDNLSNGQKEIIMIASTLLLEAPIVVADEMLRSFPEDTKVILYKRLLKYFKEKRVGLFYITHWQGAKEIIAESDFPHEVYKLQEQKLIKG